MPSSRYDVMVQCPFYLNDACFPKRNIRKITCEGISDGSNLVLQFHHVRDFHRQMENYCCRFYDKCMVYRMLMQKYEEI